VFSFELTIEKYVPLFEASKIIILKNQIQKIEPNIRGAAMTSLTCHHYFFLAAITNNSLRYTFYV